MTDLPLPRETSHTVPDQIARALRGLIRRNRVVVALRGLGATAAVWAACVLIAMAIDVSVTIFAAWPRWALNLATWGLTGLVAAWYLARPLARSFTLTNMARVLEQRHPELHERLSSAVELLTSPDAPEIRGSDSLIAMLAAEASTDARGVRAGKEITFAPARPFLLAAACVLAVLAGLYALWPQRTGRLLARVLMPGANLPNVQADQVSLTPDHDVTVARGDRLHVQVRVLNRSVNSATFRRVQRDAPESAIEMAPVSGTDSRTFVYTCPPAVESFSFRVHAGDALTRYIRVTVIPRPAIKRIDLTYHYPAYTQREPVTVENFQKAADRQARISAVAGSTVTLTARTNTPLRRVDVMVNDQVLSAEKVTLVGDNSGDKKTFEARIDIPEGLSGLVTLQPVWAVDLAENRSAAEDAPLYQYEIEALDDQKPKAEVHVQTTGGKLRLKPTDALPFGYTCRDDFGLAAAEILIEVDGQGRPPQMLASPADGAKPLRIARGRSKLDLSQLAPGGAKQVTFRVRATDNLPADRKGPQIGLSRTVTIDLAENTKPFKQQVTLAQELQIRQTLEKVLKDLKAAKTDSAPLRKELAKAEKLAREALARIGRIREKLSRADTSLRELIPNLTGQTFEVLAGTLRELADDHVSKARTIAGQIPLADQVKTRASLADETDFQIDRSIAIVSELLGKLSVMTETVRRAQELQELAKRQQELAAARAMLDHPELRPKDTPPSGAKPMTAEQIDREQAKIAERLKELARKTPGLPEARAKADKEQAANLAKQTQDLAKEQTALAGQTQETARIEQMQAEAKRLAAEQARLAEATKKAKADAKAAEAMEQAAKKLDQGRADQALPKQDEATGSLTDQKAKLDTSQTAADLARKAREIAKAQADLAKSAKDLQTAHDQAQAQADTAKKQAETAAKKAAEDQGKTGQRLAELQKAQQALAEKAKALEKDVQTNPAADRSKSTKPSPAMDAAAQDLGRKDAAQAAQKAKQAAQTAKELQQKLAQDTAHSQKAQAAQEAAAQRKATQAQAAQAKAKQATEAARAQSKAAEQAAKSARDTQKASQDAAVAAAKAEQAAPKAQARADQARQADRNAQARAKAASDAAKKPGLTPQQRKAAQDAAAKAAQKAADTHRAAETAQASAQKAQQDTAAATKAHKQAHTAAEQAAKTAAAQQKAASKAQQAARQSEQQARAKTASAKGAQQQSEQAKAASGKTQQAGQKARDLAEQQKKLAEAIAQAAGQQSQQQAAAKSAADQAHAQAEQAGQKANQAKQQVGQLAGKQDQVRQQAEQVARAAKKASGAARQAAEQHNPSDQMNKAAGAQRSQRPQAAAGETQKAAEAAEQFAKAMQQAAQQAARAAGEPAESPTTPVAARHRQQQGQRTEKLAQRQADLRRRTAELAKRQQAALQQQAKPQLARLQAEQNKIAREAAELSDRVKGANPQADRLDTKAARAAAETGRQIAAGDTPKAAETAQDAAGKLSELAKRLGAEDEAGSADKPAGSEGQQADSSGKPAGSEGQQADSSGKPAGSEGQQADSSGKPAGSEGQQADSSGKPAGSEGQQADSSGKPAGQSGKGQDGSSDPTKAKASQVAAATPGEDTREGDSAGGGQEQAQLGEDAAELAGRQKQVARQLQDLADRNPRGVMQARQEDLQRQTQQATAKAQLLQDHAEDLIGDAAARTQAAQAVAALRRAAQAQARAQQQLAQSSQRAVPSQQSSAAQLNAAAQALNRLGQQLAQAAAKAQPADEHPEDKESPLLSEALDQARRAQKQPDPTEAERAAKMLAELAQQAGQLAASMGLNPGAEPGDPMRQSQPTPGGEGTGTGPQPTDQTVAALEKMGISASDWARLPGRLRNQVLQAASDKSPPEYRTLIKRYFQDLARESRAPGRQTPSPAPTER